MVCFYELFYLLLFFTAEMTANLAKDENRMMLVEAPLQTAWESYTDEIRAQLCALSLYPTPFGLGGAGAVLGKTLHKNACRGATADRLGDLHR